MKHLLLLSVLCSLLPAPALAQTSGQWRLSKRNANGTYTDYGLTAVNGQAIGFTGGVPAMLSIGGTPAWADITGTPANVTAFGNLSNAAGLLTNNGSGSLSYTGTSADGGIFDSGKAVLYRSSGGIRAGSFQLGTNTIANPLAAGLTWTMPTTNGSVVCTGDSATVTNTMLAGSIALSKLATTGDITADNYYTADSGNPTRITQLTATGLSWYDVNGSGFGFTLRPTIGVSPTDNRIVAFNPNGNLVSTGDTGTVTNAMLADSIALSKLATTGTASASTYLRGDGAWTAIDLSGYLPLTGGTLTGPLTLTGGTVTSSTPMLSQTQTWNAIGITFRGVELTFTETGSATGSTYLRILGGAAGSTARLSVGNDKTVISGAEAGGRVLDLISVNGTAYFTVTGGGTLFFSNGAYASPSNGELRGAQVGNSSNYLGILYDSGSALAAIRPSTTTLQIGAGAASPIAYTLRGASARAGTDTNTSGASFTLAGGNGTGTGGGGQLIFQTAPTGSSGSAANTLTTRMTIKRDGVINMSGMPTSSAGLSSGDLWNDSGTVKIVP